MKTKIFLFFSFLSLAIFAFAQGIQKDSIPCPATVVANTTTNLTPSISTAIDVSKIITYQKPFGRIYLDGICPSNGTIKCYFVTSYDGVTWDAPATGSIGSLIYLNGTITNGTVKISDSFDFSGIHYIAIGQITHTALSDITNLTAKIVLNP